MHLEANQNPPSAFQWLEYKKQSDGTFVPAETDPNFMDAPPTGFTPSRLSGSGAWAHREQYDWDDLIPGSDPPHWSAILDKDSPVKIADLHKMMQSHGTHGQAIDLLRSCAPGEDVDLTDRAMNAWQSVTVKGII